MKQFLYIISLIALLSSCYKDDKLGDSIFDTTEKPLSELDQWIYDQFVATANMFIQYKWVDGDAGTRKNLVPPKEELVKPFLNVVKRVWMDVYTEQGGANFIKENSFRRMVLVGSASYNNGSITQGTAEGGVQIVLFEVNNFNHQNLNTLTRYFHVIHHEYGHILQQKIPISIDYQSITGKYDANWTDYTDAEANRLGFITAYSISEPNEDFVEILATLFTHTKEAWEAKLAKIPTNENDAVGHAAVAKIREKEEAVRSYMKTNWGIDVDSFRESSMEVINNIVAGN